MTFKNKMLAALVFRLFYGGKTRTFGFLFSAKMLKINNNSGMNECINIVMRAHVISETACKWGVG
jgi:hypothetical protein